MSEISIKNYPVQTSKVPLSIDEFLQYVGPLGTFQILVVLVSSILLFIPAYQALLMVFIAVSPPWVCSGANLTECNTTKVYYEGEMDFNLRCDMPRSSWKYEMVKKSHSIISEFDLVCSKEWQSHFINSSFFIGIILGSPIIGWLSDRYGRKPALLSSYFTMCIVSFCSSFLKDINSFIILRLINGLFYGGVVFSIIVLSVELVGPKHRSLAGLLIWESWGIAICLMSLQSYYVPDWRKLTMITSVPYIIFTLFVLFVPESIRWYRSKNQLDKAELVLQRAARINKRTFPTDVSLEPVNVKSMDEGGTYMDLFASKELRSKTLFLCFMWYTGDCLYYGVTLAFSGFGGSLHRDFVLLNLPDLFMNLASIYLTNRIGRKKCSLIGFSGTGILLVTFGVLYLANVKVTALNISLAIIIKMFSLLSWCAVEVWSIELYPTCVRSKALALFGVTGQLGAASSPWIAKGLIQFHITLPFFMLAILPVISFVFTMKLTETNGQTIPDLIDDKVTGNNTNLTPDNTSLTSESETTTKL